MLNKVQRCFLNVNAWEEYFYSKLDPLLNIFKSFSDGYIKSPLENQQRFVFENYIAFSALYQTTSSLTAKFRLNLSHELFKTTLISWNSLSQCFS